MQSRTNEAHGNTVEEADCEGCSIRLQGAGCSMGSMVDCDAAEEGEGYAEATGSIEEGEKKRGERRRRRRSSEKKRKGGGGGSRRPDEEQFLGSPDGEGAEAHHAEVQQHEEEAAQPVLDPPRVHPSIPEDESQGDGSDQGGYEVDQNEEGVAVQLPHEASGQHSQLQGIGRVGPRRAQGPGLLAQPF